MKDPNDCKFRGMITVDFNPPYEVTLKEEDGTIITIEVARLSDYLESHQEILQDIIDQELESRKPVDVFKTFGDICNPYSNVDWMLGNII